ncbi:hypothetical protein PMAYCL1PPCAC_06201 [Pristionchus mayeri]|uniref:Uncharacterized protein n=1 Tax=Pristionchus mayeri TaxID=1317129 RepID=A0AAN5CC88_9BILA|nr:hypothetical protein PMAYCL1PPCAC_06201 [Pristionchus mayeri]
MTMESFFSQYPTLKPEKREDVVKLKREFVKLLDLDPIELQREVIAAASTDQDELSRFIHRFKKFAKEEYRKLGAEDIRFVETVDEYINHRLVLAHSLKLIKEKKAEYLKSGKSIKEFAAEIMRNCSSISHKWDMDPAYAMSDEAFEDPEFVKDFDKKFRE